MYYYHPHTGRFEQSTRSTVRSTTFGSPYYRRSLDDDVLYAPYRPSVIPHYAYDTSSNEYATHSDISRELIMSSAAMEDNYDISNRSRQRDRDVLAAANRAIVDTEVHSTPRGAVAAMRSVRGHSTPPASKLSRSEVHVAIARASPNNLRYSVPPASFVEMPRRPRFPRVTVRPRYRYWFPARSTNYKYTAQKARELSPDIEGLRRAPLSLLAYLRNLELAIQRGRYRSRSAYVPVQRSRSAYVPVQRSRSAYVPVQRSYYKKAALLANKVEVNLPERKGRRPRSSYAQAKMRQLRKDKPMDDGEFETTVTSVEATTGLKAHAPVYDPTLAKPFWDAEGVKKPNIMSWKYRLDTYASPDDLFIVPRSLGSVRNQLKDVHDKLDRHRQLMDRYLLSDQGLTVEDNLALSASKAYLGERA